MDNNTIEKNDMTTNLTFKESFENTTEDSIHKVTDIILEENPNVSTIQKNDILENEIEPDLNNNIKLENLQNVEQISGQDKTSYTENGNLENGNLENGILENGEELDLKKNVNIESLQNSSPRSKADEKTSFQNDISESKNSVCEDCLKLQVRAVQLNIRRRPTKV